MAKWIPVSQIATDLDADKSTVIRWLNQGLIPGSKIGSSWKVDSDRYYSWLKQHTDSIRKENEDE